jgi:lysyl-tRNA synthetase class 2
LSGSASPEPTEFRPSATLAVLKERARIIGAVRAFFASRGVLEVETPVLCAAGAVDEHLEPVRADFHPDGPGGRALPRYLVTSPEHSMKRLLAAGSGPIYQITRAFRDGERGRLHNPEFTMLEWYRPGWDHVALMDEVEDLVGGILRGAASGQTIGVAKFDRITYREAFLDVLGFDPHRISAKDLSRAAGLEGVPPPPGLDAGDKDAWLHLLLAARVEGTLGVDRPAFLVDYPPSQAALARVRPGDPPVAERFELYARGVELANGYHELLDAREQESRFAEANEKRRAAGKPELPLDRRFLAALESGLPACAGVAVGLDRVILLAVGARSIDDVLSFPIDRA